MNGEQQRLFTLGQDLDDLQVFVPQIKREQSKEPSASPSRINTSKSVTSIMSRTPSKKQTLHKKEYVFLGHREGLSELLDSEYRLITVPEQILPITLQKGSTLLITIQLDKSKTKQLEQDILNEQLKLISEEEESKE